MTKYKIIVRIHDIINNDSDEALFTSFNTAIKRIDELNAIGLKSEKLEIEQNHYALLNSAFADLLDKINGRYYIKLSDGSQIWVDKSHGSNEFESKNKNLVENIAKFEEYESENDITQDLSTIEENLKKLTEYNLDHAEIYKENVKLTVQNTTALFNGLKTLNNTLNKFFSVEKEQKEETSINRAELELRPKYIG